MVFFHPIRRGSFSCARTAVTRRHFLLAAALVLAGGCATAPPRTLAWRTLAKGWQSGITRARRRVIRSDVEWFAFWAEHAAALARIQTPPAVDFSYEMVVAVTLGRRPTGGYAVSVVGTEAGRQRVYVRVAEIKPKAGALVTQAETQPFHFAALPRSEATVRFATTRLAG